MEKLYVVRLYDGFDNVWMDITEPIPFDEAQKVWNERTSNGTKAFKYDHIDYYKIFPANTHMLYAEDHF